MSDIGVSKLNDELAVADNPYQLLLRKFQLAHAEHGQAMLGLELLTEEELAERQEEGATDIIEIDTFLSFNDPLTDSPFRVVAVVGGPMLPSGSHGPTTERAREAWKVFSPLAKLAGAFVPLRIRETMPIVPHDAAGIWHTLLHWLNEPTEQSLNVRPGSRRLLSSSVFLDSIASIEKHGLAAGDLAESSGISEMNNRKRSVDAGPSCVESAARPKRTVNDRMKDQIDSDKKSEKSPLDRDHCIQWSAQEWARHLSCSKSTVGGTQIWKDIIEYRESLMADRTPQPFAGT